ncbi:nitrite reductase/ring-hydroxylating ferredoxin subunit [Thermocatellispora tengchongensis]|uniref:Nitrite reductase/ring-hydroxylating ferredoxin subunit n=1 Tax=Thermocatellispora tengchongensis TaxID=1073253 RepID=A0A840PFR1_9ACTN|nr:Rieske (2Fe-2S) protein [Thermocatellispora tengchongensis]MBB5135987.1 nitrite reductase/ring-hydroxylating ferredoxin subunit [Thermocatellispora tengchongensis]
MGVGRRQVLGVVAGAAGAVVVSGCAAGRSGPPVVPEELKGKVVARTGEIPVGGGKVVGDRAVVITQPSAGVFKAFTAKCPHQGCPVDRFRAGVVVCPCHGSEFALDSGACLKGPAEGPLVEFPVRVQGDGIILT